MKRERILGKFFESVIGIDQMSKAIILQRPKKGGDDFSKLRVFVRLFDQSISVLCVNKPTTKTPSFRKINSSTHTY